MLLAGIALAEEKRDVTVEAPKVESEVEFTGKPGKELKGYDAEGGEGKKLFEVPIEGTIDLGLAPFVERVVDSAGPNDVIVLNITTFGGRVDAAVRIRDALIDAEATTVAFINGRAISAGALIALSCDTIIMKPGATIGDAMPVQLGSDGKANPTGEKAISYMRAEMRATAESKGRSGDLAEAMVDPDIEIEDIIKKDKLLTLTAKQAIEHKMADATAKNFDAVVVLLNLTKAERISSKTHWAEMIARLLTDPVISSLLMTFGVLGLLMEFYTPGFGVGGIIGLCCLGLFFGGQFAANLAGWEEVLLFVIGIVLLAVEVFVIPGFGFVGVAGVLCVGVSMVMALVEIDIPLEVSWELGYMQEVMWEATVRLSLMMLVAVGATIVFGKYLPKTSLGKHMILTSATSAEAGYVSQAPEESDLLGKRGAALGDLRPAGIATFDGKRVDVVSQGGFIDKKTAVEVIQVDGNRIVVKKVT